MRFQHAVLFFFFSLLLVRSPAQDQEETPPPPPTPTPPPGVNIEFTVFVWPTEGILQSNSTIAPLPRLFYKTLAGHGVVNLIRNGATPLMRYQGPLPLILYDISEEWTPPPPDAAPGTPPTQIKKIEPRIQVKFPPHWNRVVLLVFPDGKNPDGTLKTLVLPYDSTKLKPGMARIYNATDRRLALQFKDVQEEPRRLDPFKVLDFNPKNLTGTQFARFFLYELAPEGKLQMVHTSRLFFQEDTTNFFLIHSQGPRRVRVMRIAGHASDEGNLPLPIGAEPLPPK